MIRYTVSFVGYRWNCYRNGACIGGTRTRESAERWLRGEEVEMITPSIGADIERQWGNLLDAEAAVTGKPYTR